jgi:hypothetical protein
MQVGVAIAWLWLGAIRFAGQHACPSPAQVERAFAPIAPRSWPAEDDRDETVTIESDPGSGGAVVRFGGPNAVRDISTERRLPADMPCAERARAAAVIVAAHLVARSDLQKPTAAANRSGASRPPAEPRPAEPRPVDPMPSSVVTARAATTQVPTARFGPELELGLLGSRGGSTIAPGVRAGVGAAWTGHDFVRLGLALLGTQKTEIAGGRATWSRTALALGYARRISWGAGAPDFVDLEADAVGSVLRLGSEGFRQTEASWSVHPGLAAGVRGGHRVSRQVSAWTAVGLTFWPRVQEVFLRDVPETTTLPRWELLAAVGASWALK